MAETLETIRTAINELVFNDKERATPFPVQPGWSEDKKMHCLVWNGKFDIEYVEHPRPIITDPKDVILRITATTICGSDLHLYKGTFMGMRKNDIPGHEFMGIVEETGPEVKAVKKGDRVIAGFAIACGNCRYCKEEEYTLCDETNPCKTLDHIYGDRLSAIHGYSFLTGSVPGGQAEYVRVANADVNCFVLPEDIPDEKALYLTDVIPTAYHGAVMGRVKKGDTVGIWGLGPIGLMCARWCQILGASKIIGIDNIPERLDKAKIDLGIEVIDFKSEDVCSAVRDRLGLPSGLDVGIECAGFDYPQSWVHKVEMKLGLETDTSEILQEMVRTVRKGGNISIMGIYTGYANHFPIGAIMEKSITIRGGQCPSQRYWKFCTEKIQSGELDPTFIITDKGALSDGPKFYEKMNNKEAGCIKVFMRPDSIAKENILQDFGSN